MTRRQDGPSRPDSHLVTFRLGGAYGRGGERLEIRPGTRLVGTLYDGAEPIPELPAMSLGLSRNMVEIAPNTDPKLTLRALAQQSEREARETLAAGDAHGAVERFLEAAVQYRLLADLPMAEAMQLAARQAHTQFLRTPEGRADFDRHTAQLSDKALRQLGATVRAALRQLGGYQYAPATFAEALAAAAVAMDRSHPDLPPDRRAAATRSSISDADLYLGRHGGDLGRRPQRADGAGGPRV